MKLLVVSNMFPNKKNPSYGIFVKRFCEQLEIINVDYKKSVMYKGQNKITKFINYIVFFIKTIFLYTFCKYDAVYIHYGSISSIPILIARIFKKKKVIVNFHGSDIVPENKKQEKLTIFTKLIIQRSTLIVVPSMYFKEYLKKEYYVNDSKIYISPSGGVNEKVFYEMSKRDKIKSKEKFQIPKDCMVFGFVGRISYGKGWDTLVKAISISKKHLRKKTIFIIVGSGEEEDKLEELIKELKVEQYILRFPLMSQEELHEMYNCFDCFIFPTERKGESLGLVGLESMACGCPIIGSDYAALKYYITTLNGFKFRKGDSKELANKIIEFENLSNEKIRKMKENAILTSKKYSISNCIKTLKKILDVIK